MKWDQLKEMPSPHYLSGMNNQQIRFEDIIRKHPEWKQYVEYGFFSEPIDNLGHMGSEPYNKIWQLAQKENDYLDAFLHLKRAIKIKGIGIGKEEKNKLKNWSLNDFKMWVNKFIEEEGIQSLPIFSLKEIGD
jgi:hypothetical protein